MAALPSLIHEVGDHVGECLGSHLPGLLQLVHVPNQQVIIVEGWVAKLVRDRWLSLEGRVAKSVARQLATAVL